MIGINILENMNAENCQGFLCTLKEGKLIFVADNDTKK